MESEGLATLEEILPQLDPKLVHVHYQLPNNELLPHQEFEWLEAMRNVHFQVDPDSQAATLIYEFVSGVKYGELDMQSESIRIIAKALQEFLDGRSIDAQFNSFKQILGLPSRGRPKSRGESAILQMKIAWRILKHHWSGIPLDDALTLVVNEDGDNFDYPVKNALRRKYKKYLDSISDWLEEVHKEHPINHATAEEIMASDDRAIYCLQYSRLEGADPRLCFVEEPGKPVRIRKDLKR